MSFNETVTPTRGDLALVYAKHGLHVFPLRVNETIPGTRSGARAATTDEVTLRQWWAQRDWNIGIATRPSKLVGLECLGVPPKTKRVQRDDFTPPEDVVDHEAMNPNGTTDLLDLLFELEQGFPQTHAVGLPNGGVCFWFATTFYRNVKSAELTPLINVIGLEDDAYLVAPGSIVDGFTYDVGSEAWQYEELPSWIASMAAGAGA